MDGTDREEATRILAEGPYLPIAVGRAAVHALLAIESRLAELIQQREQLRSSPGVDA